MKKSLIVALLLVTMVCSSLFANGNSETVTGKPKVAFICKSYSDAFCVWVKDEIEKNAKENYSNQFDVICFDSAGNSTTQINQIENCVASKFDVIIFQQVDAQATVPAVKKAVAAGIPVIVTTGHIEDGGLSTYIDANPVQQGTVVAEYALTKLPTNSKICILQGPAGNFHANGRQKGFVDTLGKRSDIQIVDAQIGEWGKDKAVTITQNWLSSIPDLTCIMAHNDDMALGAYEAIKMAKKQGQIQIYGVDALASACLAVQDGRMEATVFQNAIGYAVKALEYASKTLKGEAIESITLDSELVTPENVNKYIELHKMLGNI
ncbi:ABC-type sugar transport system, periplasmic component [Sphaerochaeta pleomorpha str. Grapes]|uniref:ABC-type sugar transport system, periplasmic component n=1 Tax=Sphaerochaeta pleomorpha (strain ATCC BAA-1885 / DSM 22778 / Grapes) TaxID=158190 RepID=G8QXI5_SPHPG|nr:sugar ABC transporter substrate-binding protein [Sphaerochaeta pleomorpha]AEV29548.1 ABC-type sugar transport system, periplasmic component [Sphaerochaeta pleomorpha str. Grapes]